MTKTSVASVLLGNRIEKDKEDYKRILNSDSVVNMSTEDIIRIADLEDSKEVYWILKVYSTRDFNYIGEDQEYYRFTDEEKKQLVDVIFSAQGGPQFLYACKTFCGLNIAYLNGNHERAIEIVNVVASANKDYQSKWGYATANIDFISGCGRVIDILNFITSLDDENLISQAYYEFASLEDIEFEEGITFNEKVQQIIDKYTQIKNPRGMSDMFPLEEMDDYIEKDEPRIIRVKSIKTLKSVYARRRKVER